MPDQLPCWAAQPSGDRCCPQPLCYCVGPAGDGRRSTRPKPGCSICWATSCPLTVTTGLWTAAGRRSGEWEVGGGGTPTGSAGGQQTFARLVVAALALPCARDSWRPQRGRQACSLPASRRSEPSTGCLSCHQPPTHPIPKPHTTQHTHTHTHARRYVIDFYNAAPNPDMPVAMHLDVRPALDSAGCAQGGTRLERAARPRGSGLAARLCSSACTGTNQTAAYDVPARPASFPCRIVRSRCLWSHLPLARGFCPPSARRALWDRLRMQWGWVASGRWARE